MAIIIRVNMTDQSIKSEQTPEKYKFLGGRGLTSHIIYNEVSPKSDALGPENKLVFAPGYLTATPLINTGRLSIGAKSPLTGGIKESNVGGSAAYALARIGIAAVVIEGASADGYFFLKINKDGSASLIRADAFKGTRTYDLAKQLNSQYPNTYSMTCIGPAGDFQLSSASIQSTDLDGYPCRAAGRGGLGAVMGSKGLKALLVERGGNSPAPLISKDKFMEAAKSWATAVKNDELTGQILPELGTAFLVEPINAAGALPTRNARYGQFEKAEKISGETMARIIKTRKGKTRHKGCSQCIVNCSNVYVDKDGSYMTSSLEYETIWSMGPMIGNDNLDAIARLDFLCDDIGLDTMSTGVAVAVAMDAGYKSFGDADAAIEMVEEAAKGTPFGKIIGSGPDAVGKYFKHQRVPTVKGQSIAAYDPRAIQGMAVTYSTSPMGGDHTAGWVADQNLEAFGGTIDPLGSDGQVEASRKAQIHMAAIDTMGICDFSQTGLTAPEGMDNLYQMISAKSGEVFADEDWNDLGVQIIKIELEFNKKAGISKKQDRLPKMFYEEPLPPHNTVVIIPDKELETIFEF